MRPKHGLPKRIRATDGDIARELIQIQSPAPTSFSPRQNFTFSCRNLLSKVSPC